MHILTIGIPQISESESWLISPNIDLSNSVEPYLNFDNVSRFEGDMLKLLISLIMMAKETQMILFGEIFQVMQIGI